VKSFLLRCALFLALLAGVLWLLTRITDADLRRRKTGRLKAWNEMAAGMLNADLLIMGSSHARVQVNPKLLAPLFPQWRIYNAGMDGYTFPVQLARYQFYRRFNKTPQVLLLCLDYMEFGKSEFRIDPIQFLPYASDSSVLRALLDMGVSWPRVCIPFLKYRGEANVVLAALVAGASLPGERNVSSGPDGFMPVQEHWSEEAFLRDTMQEHYRVLFDSGIWHSFQHFRQQCRDEGITLVTVFTPHHSRFRTKMKDGEAYRNWLRRMLEPQTPFIDFSEAPFCADTSLFYNPTHLNAKGTEVFTRALADSLRRRGLAAAH
jgi:hypothetical protein